MATNRSIPAYAGDPNRASFAIRARRRSIPAYAGDPAAARAAAEPAEVYPRLRGGSNASLPHRYTYIGLSPPTRGIRQSRAASTPISRSIPAYAGDPHLLHLARRATQVYPRLRGGSARTAAYRTP